MRLIIGLIPVLLAASLLGCDSPGDDACGLPCGDGFLCAHDRCELDPTATVGAEIVLPDVSTVSAAVNVALSCRARAPQLRSVEMHLASADSSLTVALESQGATGLHVGSVRVAEGEWTATCRLLFGPDGFERSSDSLERVFLIDRTPPKITIPAISAWHAHSGTTLVKATIVDEGGSATKKAGIDGATVRLTVAGETISGTSGAGDTWTFAVQPAAVTSNSIEGALDFTITASDKVGNEASETSLMNVDASGPTLAMTPPSSWRSRDAAKFSLVAKVTASGAGVSSVTLSGAGGTPSLTGTQVGDDYQFEITPSEWQAAASEEPVAWILKAVDEAGNEEILEGTFKLDGKGPTMAANVPDGWVGGVQYDLSVAVSDEASGVDESSVRWSAGGVDGDCTKESAGQYVCNVSLTTAEGSTDDKYGVTLSAEDAVGNASQSNVMLKVDRQGPTVTLHNDGAWYGRGATVTVKATASDVGAGLGGTAVFRTTAPKQSTTSGTLSGNSVTFEVLAADVAPENVTTASITASIQICDAVSNCTEVSANDLFKVDDEAPSITLGNDLAYLSGNGEALRRDPAGGDRAKVTFSATVTDGGAGVAGSDVRLAFTGVDGNPKEIPAKSQNGDVYAFEFDAKDAQFNAGEGDIELRVVAKDGAGKDGESEAASVLVTRKLWETEKPDIPASVIGATAVADGRIYYALAIHGGASDNVFSVNSADGSLAWSAQVTGTPATPVTVGEKLVYLGSDVGNGSFHAFRRDVPTKEGVQAWLCTMTTAPGGGLALGRYKWASGEAETVLGTTTLSYLYAARELDGVCDSKFGQAGGDLIGHSDVSIDAGGNIYAGSTKRGLGRATPLFLNASLFSNLAFSHYSSTSTRVEGTSLSTTSAIFVDTSGIYESSLDMSDASKIEVPGLDGVPRTPLVMRDGRAVIATDSGKLAVVARDGSFVRIESLRTQDGIETPIEISPVLGESAGDVEILVGAQDGRIFSFNSRLEPNWSYDASAIVAQGFSASPALDCDGVMYIGTTKGQILALITDSTGLADTPWPKYQHDNRNTGNAATSNACPTPTP